MEKFNFGGLFNIVNNQTGPTPPTPTNITKTFRDGVFYVETINIP